MLHLLPCDLLYYDRHLRPAHNIIIYLIKYVYKRELGTHIRQLLKHNENLLILYEDCLVSVTTRHYSDLGGMHSTDFLVVMQLNIHVCPGR